MKICNICKTIMEDDAAYCPRCKNTDLAPFETTRCTFCNAEIAVGTVVCPHCHRIQPPDERPSEEVSVKASVEPPKAVLFERPAAEEERKVKEEVQEIVEKEVGVKPPEGAKEVRSEVFERKTPEGSTIIYNQIYTAPHPVSEMPKHDEEDEELSSYSIKGTPTIVSVDKNGYVKENKRLERIYVEKKVKKPRKTPKTYALTKRVTITVIAAVIVLSVGIGAVMFFDFITTPVMGISGSGVALTKLPFDLGVYSNFDAYAEKTNLSGSMLALYNILPYALDGAVVLAGLAILFTLLALLCKKGIRPTAIVFGILSALPTMFIIWAQSYIFDVSRVGIGLYVLLAASVLATAIVSIGIKLEEKK